MKTRKESILTGKEITRIFGMYLPCDGYNKKVNTKVEITGTNDYGVFAIYPNNIPMEFTTWHYSRRKIKLLLTPLSKITDEHAIEIANIHKKDKWEVVYRNDRVFVRSETENFGIYSDYHSIIRVNEYDPSGWSSEPDLLVNNIVEIIDRLRELGYALPYKGKSLFELGIAIDKTTLK